MLGGGYRPRLILVMKILMIESITTPAGLFNTNEVYDVDIDIGNEWVKLGYAISAGGGREATSKAPAKYNAMKRGAFKR